MTTVARTTIRPGTVDDAAAIAEVHVASWRWAYEGLLSDAVLGALSTDERTAGWLPILADPSNAVFVATDDRSGVVGFASVGATRDGDAPPGTGELFALYLRAEAAGLGTGRALLMSAEAALRAAGFARATLWVLESNERARRFYERHGWLWDGTRSAHRFDCEERPIVRYARELVAPAP